MWAVALCAVCAVCEGARAQDTPGVLLEAKFVPAARAQIAMWIETAGGRFLRTLRLTEAVAFRGIGNRPGASQMNSGYRWPYGRREGALPIWATRRAASPAAKQFRRVIFQRRTYEGLASRTAADQSVDNYFCLSFDKKTTTQDAFDAVSCASVFTSDKGRFITDEDLTANYHEPWEDPLTHVGIQAPLSLQSLYPPRMDATYCADSSACFDHTDVAAFAEHARDVMPEIDAVTIATPPGNAEQNWLFDLPSDWPAGKYVLWVEVNVEGDYNANHNATSYPTPATPGNEWDSWARDFGYAYRGQPSIAYAVPFSLSVVDDATYGVAEPAGRSSWDSRADDYGALEPLDSMTDDPSKAPGSGIDRLHMGSDGQRITVRVQTLGELPDLGPEPEFPPDARSIPVDEGADEPVTDVADDPESLTDAGVSEPDAKSAGGDDDGAQAADAPQRDPESDAVILTAPRAGDAVGAVRGLRLVRAAEVLHAHEWIGIRFKAADSDEPLHGYEVRVATKAIVDVASFIREGRPAKTASADAEGAVSLVLPADVPAGGDIESEIGDLAEQTHYYVGVRAVDRLNRQGPISVAQITTPKRTFATVTPCFVATAAYGSPLAAEVGVLRRLRDRHLQTNAGGRALVRAYYQHGAAWAQSLREHALLRRAVRGLLEPLIGLSRVFAR